MNNKQIIETLNKIGHRLTGLTILSIISLIWFWEYLFVWRIFFTIGFVLIVVAFISVYLESKENEDNY